MNHNGDSLDLVHYDPAHTDTDIYIHFHNADVLHVGDIFFNQSYPFIDEGSRADRSAARSLRARSRFDSRVEDEDHSRPRPLADKADLKAYLDMLSTCATRWRR